MSQEDLTQQEAPADTAVQTEASPAETDAPAAEVSRLEALEQELLGMKRELVDSNEVLADTYDQQGNLDKQLKFYLEKEEVVRQKLIGNQTRLHEILGENHELQAKILDTELEIRRIRVQEQQDRLSQL